MSKRQEKYFLNRKKETQATKLANPDYLLGMPSETSQADYGLLARLEGRWQGTGLVCISLPHFTQDADSKSKEPFRFVLRTTKDEFQFDKIQGPVVDRGSKEKDEVAFGLSYTAKAFDLRTEELLHVEQGMFMNVLTTHAPTPTPQEPSERIILRMATVPHGNALLAQSSVCAKKRGGPEIDDVSTTPVGPGVDAPGYLNPITNAPLPAGVKREDVANPNRWLKRALRGLEFRSTATIRMSTRKNGGLVNSAYVRENADTTRMDATFWIAKSRADEAGAPSVRRLVYTQTVMIEFDGIKWPHVSVGVLEKKD